MNIDDLHNIIVDFYSITAILFVILIGVIVKIIFPILDRRNRQKLEILELKLEKLEEKINLDVAELKSEIITINNNLPELGNDIKDILNILNKSNIKQIQKDNLKNVGFENHEQRLKVLERDLQELKK